MPTTTQFEARAEMLDAMSAALSAIKCGGCTACCKHDRVLLSPQDDPGAYRWHLESDTLVLDRNDDGSCVYLGPTGCGIHGQAPTICRRFDCRVLVQITPLAQRARRVRQNQQMALIYAAGAERLRTTGEK